MPELFRTIHNTQPARRARRRAAAIGVLSGLLCLVVAPEVRAADDETGAWLIFTATETLSAGGRDSRWHYWFDAQARYVDFGSGANQYLVRPGIGYKPGDNVSYWVGYARFRTRSATGSVVDENRYWQQVSFTAARGEKGSLSMRARLEERDVENSDDMGLVLRLLVRYTRPFDAGSKSLIVGVEPFFNLRETDWGGGTGIVQNRLYAGIGWRVSGKLRIETGYMNQYVSRRNARDRSNHLLVVNFRTAF